MAAPSNIWSVEFSRGDEDDPWPDGLRGERLLHRPSGTRLVSAVWELDPGAASAAYHVHHATEELLLVLRGEPTLRTPEGERALNEGDVVHFPIGAAGAHQILNHSTQVVRYMMVAAHTGVDIIEYVDDRKIVAYSNADSLVQGEPLFFWHQLSDDG